VSNYAFARVDKNHKDIRMAARLCGFLWIDTFRAGEGAPDAWIATRSGRWLPLEIKSPGGKLEPKEQTIATACENHGAPYIVVHSWDELQAALEEYA
jgi:hypothetical protein